MKADTRRSTRRLVWLAVAAFGFAFALVPMYNIACEKVFGIKLDNTASDAPAPAAKAAVDEKRTVQVFFDASVNSKLPWRFTPNQASMQVVPGRIYEASYSARNTADFATVGNAAPSIAPNQYSGFFSKTECFCFTEQVLQPGERVVMPVSFYVDPSIVKDAEAGRIAEITLSYTFFINNDATVKLNADQAKAAVPAAP